MVTRSIIFLLLLCCGAAAQTNAPINGAPSDWSESWTLYDEDSLYMPGKQEWYELCYAINERVKATRFAMYSYYEPLRRISGTPTEYYFRNGLFSWADTWANLPAIFGIRTNTITGEWVDDKPFNLTIETYTSRLLWDEMVKRTMMIAAVYLPGTNTYSDDALMAYLNGSGVDMFLTPNFVRTFDQDGIYDFSRPGFLPVYNHHTLFEEVELPYTDVIDPSNPTNRRIVAAFPAAEEQRFALMTEWGPVYDGTNWQYRETVGRVENFMRYGDYELIDMHTRFYPEGKFVVRFRWTNETVAPPSIPVTISYLYMTDELESAATNRQPSRNGYWGDDSDQYPHPRLYSSMAFLYKYTNATESFDTPWETTRHVIAITNMEVGVSSADNMPKVVAGYSNASAYGYAYSPADYRGDAFPEGDWYPTWKEMHQLRRMLLKMERMPCQIGLYEVGPHYYSGWSQERGTNKMYAGKQIGWNCGDFDTAIPVYGGWVSATGGNYTNAMEYYSQDNQSIVVGNIFRRQMITTPYTNTPTNYVSVTAWGKYSEIDGAYVPFDAHDDIEESKLKSVTIFWTQPYSLGTEYDQTPPYGTSYFATSRTNWPMFRDESMVNMVDNMGASEYVNSITLPVTNIVDAGWYGGIRAVQFEAALPDLDAEVETYIDGNLESAVNDVCTLSPYTNYNNTVETTYFKWNGYAGKHVCVGVVGYMNFDFDLK